MDLWNRLGQCVGFDWDEGNLTKNWEKHRVAFWEAEQAFLSSPLLVASAPHSSGSEERHYCLGKTDAERLLFIVFTLRSQRIRVVSARDMSRKERNFYLRHAEENYPSI